MALNTFTQYVLSNQAVIASGSSTVYVNYNTHFVSLIINITGSVTGTTPTIAFTIKEVDPGNLTTVMGASVTGATLNSATTQIITIPVTMTGCLQVSWTVTGSTPSFGGVYATLVDKMEPPAIYDSSGNGPVAVKPASTAPIATDKALVVVLSPNQPVIPVSSTPATSAPGIAQGYVQTTAVTNVPCSATVYTEQTVNFTGSIKSSSAADTAAGTGARTVIISYVDQTGATAGTETVTLNGTTAVNLVTTTKCFIERMEIVTVGSGGTNAGIISLFNAAAGGGTLVTTIAAGDNRTYHGHHYVISGQTCNITGMTGFNSSTSNQTIFTIQAQTVPTANQASVQVSDWVTGYALTQALRTYGSLIKVPGPARVQLYCAPGGTPSIKNQGSFDYYDQ